MEIGSDGSLCRITSSAAQHNNAMVIVPESELEKSKGPPYKILIIGTIENPCESSSESDEEIDEEVPKMIESSIGNGGKANTSSDKKTGVNELRGKERSMSNRNHNRHPFKSFKNRRPYNQHKFQNRHNTSGKRNSYSQKSSAKIYSDIPSSNADNIDPWLINPTPIMLPNYQYPIYPQFPVLPPIEPHVPKQLNCESSTNYGLLGDSPYGSFPPPNQIIPDQNYWNDETAMHEANYWTGSHSSNYQRPVPTDRPVSKPKNFQHRKHFQKKGYPQWRSRGRNAHRWN